MILDALKDWKRKSLPLQLVRGAYPDRWLQLQARFEIIGAQEAKLRFFLPKSDAGPKTVRLIVDCGDAGIAEIRRGRMTEVGFRLPNDGLHIFDVLTDQPEHSAKEIRSLGVVLTDYSMDDGDWTPFPQAMRYANLPAGEAGYLSGLDETAIAATLASATLIAMPVTPPGDPLFEPYWCAAEALDRGAISGWLYSIAEPAEEQAVDVLLHGSVVERLRAGSFDAARLVHGIAAASSAFRIDLSSYRMPGRPQDVQLRIAGPDGGDIKVAIRPELQEQRTAPAVAQPAPSPEPELAGSSANVPVANGTTEWNGYAETAWRIRKPPARDPAALGFTLALRGADLVEVVRGLRFPTLDDPPKISVVIPCYGQDLYTAECIASIHAALPKNFGVEIVVADNASGGPFYEALHEHPGICTLRFPENRGFGPACNAAAEAASGEYLFLLNNDAQVAPGTFETLAASFESWPGEVGALGPKLLSFDGTLQEAGCRLHPDGTGTLVGFGADHREPRFNYRRRVEHVSGAAVMIRRDTFLELGGFDPLFAPAYCEDADLSLKLRARGMDIVYEPAAIVAHHLSGTSNAVDRINSDVRRSKRQRVAANRLSLVTRWADVLSETGLRTIALYLPQYHPVPQNDLWWGKGFTDWRNLATAKPKFRGHPQPRTPADLGYYDLRLPEVMTAQAELAKRYGISGFCYYYYWFSGQKILETPIERLLASGTPDLPFCICWANENWTRRWDGREDAVLMKQDYDESQAAEFAEAVAPILAAKTYIKVSGRPILLIYRVKEIPGPKRFIDVIRNVCRTKGVGEITVAMVESFDLSARPEPPHSYGCDITVEFPAHGMVHDPAIPVERLDPEWNGAMHDYRELAGAFMTRPEAGFKRLRSVLVGWDSTPRHPTRSLVLGHATPGAFQAWLEWTYRRTLEQNTGDERVVFINAWNEWCEGSYLEPDMRFGHAYLQAVRNALEAAAEVSHVFVP